MSAGSSTSASSTSPKSTKGFSLRAWGVLLLVMFLLTSAVGGSLALESSYVLATLVSHIGLALITLVLAGYGGAILGRPYKPVPRAFVGLAALSALVATVAGTIFYLGGQSNPALYAMEGFAGLGILASLLLIVFGGESGKRAPWEKLVET
jgi:hypothetical protein